MAAFINIFVLIATALGGLSMLALTRRNFLQYHIWRREAQEKAEAAAAEVSWKAIALSESFSPNPSILSSYLSYLKGKNAQGEIDFPVNEVYYFTVEEQFYYAELAQGRYLVNKTLNELETELDPSQFYRIKRDYIVNRQAVVHYSYWENGKYIVQLNSPNEDKIIVTRIIMHEFREWWLRAQAPSTESLKVDDESKAEKKQ